MREEEDALEVEDAVDVKNGIRRRYFRARR